MSKDSLGDRMKFFEQRFSISVMPKTPILARIDGRSFHSFTRGLERPYDIRLSNLMIATTKFLVAETNARCGYTQSDEISLVWLTEDDHEETFFGGKLSKLTSVIGSLATAYFNKHLSAYIPEKADAMPVFDNRVWELPTYEEVANYFIWREQDAVRNSIQMSARSVFSHSECHKKNTSQLQEMLFSKGINWNDYPRFFRRGTYIRRRVVEREFTPEELANLPPKHNALKDPNLPIRRTVIMEEDFPILTKVQNRSGVILFGADPIVQNDVLVIDEA
jgi:tRNA(His) 5'-end guanylyltransferase